MNELVQDLQVTLEQERTELTNEIRRLEVNLTFLKEKYFKVQGAIEILDVYVKRVGVTMSELAVNDITGSDVK